MILTLDSQPKEVLTIISSYLEQKDKYNLWLVNKRFNKIIDINLTDKQIHDITKELFILTVPNKDPVFGYASNDIITNKGTINSWFNRRYIELFCRFEINDFELLNYKKRGGNYFKFYEDNYIDIVFEDLYKLGLEPNKQLFKHIYQKLDIMKYINKSDKQKLLS